MSSTNLNNEKAYEESMQKYINLIKPHFKFNYSGFNTQGGIGWELRNDTDSINIYLWFFDKTIHDDILPEYYDKHKTYEIAIQIESYDGNVVKTFEDIDSAIQYLQQKN